MNKKFEFYSRLIVALLGWAAIIVTIYLRISNITEIGASYLGIFRPWRTFTIQTNTLVLLYWTFSLFYFNKKNKPFFLRPAFKGGLAVYITVTFIIFAIFLEGLSDLQGLRAFTSAIFHYVIPLAFIADYFLNTKRESLRFSHIGYWMIYPICYSIFLIIYGVVSHVYVYPFFNIEKLGWTRTLINGFLLTLFIIFLGFVYVLLDRHHPGRLVKKGRL